MPEYQHIVAILHRHDQRNSANDAFPSKRHYSVQQKHGSYSSFSSKNRYCLHWCYWQCPAWKQILLCFWDCGLASKPRKSSTGIILRNKPQHTIHFLLSSIILPHWKYFIQKKISTHVADVWWAVVCLREGERGTCLRPPLFASPPCGATHVNFPYFWWKTSYSLI